MCKIELLVTILLLIVSDSSEQNELKSPCPELFQYRYDGSEWYGSIDLPSPPLGQTVKLNVLLSIKGTLPTQYVGNLELFSSRESTIQAIRYHQPVRYRVRFPLQSPLPKLTQILYNNQVICASSQETLGFVTAIRLEHTLFTELAGQQTPSNNDNGSSSPPIYGTNYPVVTQAPAPTPSPQQPQQPQPQYYPQTRPTIPPTSIANNNNNNQPETIFIRPSQGEQLSPSNVPIIPKPQNPQQTVQIQQQQFGSNTNIKCGRTHDKFQISPLIVGGEKIQRGSWPWLVAIYINKATGLSFNCGGNLVSNKVVVTAAHCFTSSSTKYTPNDVVIFLGRYNIMKWMEAGSVVSEVESIHIHSDYMQTDSSFDADIAVVLMKTRVQYNEYIRPICLWEGSDNLNDIVNSAGIVVGWGRDGNGHIVTPEPRKINIPIVSEAVCLRSSDTYRYITSKRTFCAGKRDGYGPCNGDSGSGMAMYKNNHIVLRGIVSAALADPVMNTCNLGEYVVFTDAAKFVNWIRSFMNQ